MKKTYESIKMEIFLFEKKDVLVASAILPVDHDNAYIDYSTVLDGFFMN